MKNINPELIAIQKQVKSSTNGLKFKLSRIEKYLGKEPEGYLLTLCRWITEDVNNELKENIKRYYKTKEYSNK